MPNRLTPDAYQNIHAQALLHILKGGGVVPDDGATDIEDAISTVANEHFSADAAIEEFRTTIETLDADTRERISSIMWLVVARHGYGAFSLGAAVAMQLRGRPAPRRESTPRTKGGRS
jgi:hypothetical protein